MEPLSLYGVGDVMPDRPNAEYLFELALPTIKKADILFGQLEAPLSEKGEPQLHMLPVRKISPDSVSAVKQAGFGVMSFASNHHLDRGEAAFFETLDLMAKAKIPLVGVGKNIEEARKPVILECKGVKVAFLAYCSALPKGYDARAEKSGCAPMRATTFYEQIDWQPGTPPRIVSIADKQDLAAMVEDIKKVRPLADIVVMSIHWGVHIVPAVIAMYQKEVGYAAIDAGVDVILGHHAHILKGIEFYKGKPIFYSLCNFVSPSRGRSHAIFTMYNVKEDPEYSEYVFPADSRKSMIAKCIITDKKISRVSFIPLYVNKKAQPEVLQPQDKRFGEVVDYMREITESAGLNAKYRIDGDEVVVST